MICRNLLTAASAIIAVRSDYPAVHAFFAPPPPALFSAIVNHHAHRTSSVSSSAAITTYSSLPMVASSPSSSTSADDVDDDGIGTRRNFLSDWSMRTTTALGFIVATAGTAATAAPGTACALDFDAFERTLLDSDTIKCDPRLDVKCIPPLTHDEALCKYGVAGATERTAACRRVRDAGGKLPTKSAAGERSTMGWLNGDIALTTK